jgi:hypothetical protein
MRIKDKVALVAGSANSGFSEIALRKKEMG